MDDKDQVELIEKARQGDRQSLERLAEEARVRLRGYVLRLTMDDDLAGDIVQESILEMFKIFGKLKRTESFWPWLYRIAFNKVRSHYGYKWRHKTVSLSHEDCHIKAEDSHDGLAELVAAEWKQIVVKSMRQLQPRHRAVLAMRCYDQMKYSEIAKTMGCSEFGVRALFYRAKKTLAAKLAANGLGRGSLLAGLILFGKMTATSEAAVAGISVSSATLKVGALAAAAGIAASKTVIVSLSAAAVVAVGGTVALSPDEGKLPVAAKQCLAKTPDISPAARNGVDGILECWHFFPQGADGPVMTRGIRVDNQGATLYCQWLQNDQANYHFDNRKNTLFINNYNLWAKNLSVWRLPTDSVQMSDFLSQMESGSDAGTECVVSKELGLLAIATTGADEGNGLTQVVQHRNLLSEDYFQFDWPVGVRVVDNRDDMHERGWTYFLIKGEIADQQVRGSGRIPFLYAASQQYYPWLRLDTGETVLVDAGDGRLFKGFSQPWMGLHTIDTVRRDAAERYVSFETKYKQSEAKAEVVLTCAGGKLAYTIDMEADLIDKITFLSEADEVTGRLQFTYLQDIEGVGDEFAEPGVGEYGNLYEEAGMLWLVQLAEGALGK